MTRINVVHPTVLTDQHLMAIINKAYKAGKLIQRRTAGTHYWKFDVPPFYTHKC